MQRMNLSGWMAILKPQNEHQSRPIEQVLYFQHNLFLKSNFEQFVLNMVLSLLLYLVVFID